MASVYYSTVFVQAAPEVWKIIRDFNNYTVWVAGAGESRIEDGKSGDTVGAIRNVLYQERRIRQRLLALSDADRSQVYEFCGEGSLPLSDFRATIFTSPLSLTSCLGFGTRKSPNEPPRRFLSARCANRSSSTLSKPAIAR